jgi:hypothetical protein
MMRERGLHVDHTTIYRWAQRYASLMREMETERWLRRLLDVLEGKVGVPDGPINPSRTVNIDPMFVAEHPPLIGREMWVDVNVRQIRNMGTKGWLRQLLDVLNGDIVTTEEVGLAPSAARSVTEHPAIMKHTRYEIRSCTIFLFYGIYSHMAPSCERFSLRCAGRHSVSS